MKRKRPKDRDAMKMKEIGDYVLRGANDINVVVGPLCWTPSDGAARKSWYFIVATSEAERGFRCDKITVGENRHEGTSNRLRFFAEMTGRGALVIHDTDDELYMLRLCESLWPGERVITLRKNVEAERAAA